MRSRIKPEWQKRIARERIAILFSLANQAFARHPNRAHRYVALARRIGKRYNLKMNAAYKGRFCKQCLHFLKPGVNVRVRTKSPQRMVIQECLDCGHRNREPYRRESI